MEHLNISEVIADGIEPDEPRVVAHWEAGKTETPIHIQCGIFAGRLKPNVDTLMPACVAAMLVDSGYDVEIKFNAIVNPEADAGVEEAVAALEAAREKAAELVKLSVDKLSAALPGLDLNTLRFTLDAEEHGQKRASAIKALEAAIDGHPDQIAALAAADQQPPENEQAS